MLGSIAAVLLMGVLGAVAGVYAYAQNALSNVYVTLDRVTVNTQTPSGGTGLLDLVTRGLSTDVVLDQSFEVDNRNAIGATVESIDYRVRVNGREVGTGHAPETGPQKIAGHAKQPIVARTKLPMTSLLAAGADAVAAGQANIDVVGTARIQVLVFTVEREFRLVPQKLEGERLDRVLGGRR
jgi:LEA14-like dessication related protein